MEKDTTTKRSDSKREREWNGHKRKEMMGVSESGHGITKESKRFHGIGLVGNDGGLESYTIASISRSVTETSLPTSHPLPPSTKVSSISTIHENKGVSIIRSDEVHGKSSTDGTSSTAGKSGKLSLDALRAKDKELKEKLKKIPLLNLPSVSVGMLHGSAPSTLNSSTLIPNYEAEKRAQDVACRTGLPEFAIPRKPTEAHVLRLDALSREIDEHGNVVNVAKPNNLSTLKVNINRQKKEEFEILKSDFEVDPESNPHFDARMGINKTKLLRPKRMNFQFLEEGKWSKEAEHLKLKSKFGEAQAKEHKFKQAQLAKAKAAPDINPNLIEVSERVITKEKPPKDDPIPEIEWWDVPLLHSGTYGEIAGGVIPEDRIKWDKITIYVQHPRPIEPPAEPAPPAPQPLKLTEKERKKLRKQCRLAREKDRQEMIRQGLIEPPKPKVKMSNLMKVLGSEATQDPTRLEKQVRIAAAEREQAHIDRNMARKLTPAERREKKDRKLFDDPNKAETTIVSVYKINKCLSYPRSIIKVGMYARNNRLTGCAAVINSDDGISVVVVEGGTKSIKRYGKVMANIAKDESDDEKGVNKCVLVWQGSVAKQAFNRFLIHECMTEAAARKTFSDAGVVHYWDIAVNSEPL